MEECYEPSHAAVLRGDALRLRAAIADWPPLLDIRWAGCANAAAHLAVEQRSVECLRVLLQAGAEPNAADPRLGVPLLLLAAGGGALDCLQALLAAGADVRACCPNGSTALMRAVHGRHGACMACLLAHGADMAAEDCVPGRTAVMWAAEAGQAAVLGQLLQAGGARL